MAATIRLLPNYAPLDRTPPTPFTPPARPVRVIDPNPERRTKKRRFPR